MSWAEAATFPNVFITAHDAVVTNGQLRAGESILVNAASGGVGLAAIQIASLLGAKPVFATSRSASKLERLASFGVDQDERELFLGVIEGRVRSRQTGADWQRQALKRRGGDLQEMMSAYCEGQRSAAPVHEWDL